MPIKGRTDQPSKKIGLPLLGRLYKGDPKRVVTNKQGKQIEIMGADTQHFRVEFELSKVTNPSVEDRLLLDHYRKWFVDIYGEKPTRFDDIVMIDEHPEQALESWFEHHDGKGMLEQCDGETLNKWWDQVSRRVVNTPAPCYFQTKGQCECAPVGKLRFVLGKFTQITRVVGYFQIATHSNNDIDNIHAALWRIFSYTGDLRRVSFTLTRMPIRMGFVDEKTGERGKTVKSLLQLSGNAEFADQYVLPPPTPTPPPQLAGKDIPLLDSGETPVDELPSTVIDEDDDPPPPPRPRLMLKNMTLRNSFIVQAKQHGIEADEILDRCGVSDFNTLEWYEAAEVLGIAIDPPADKERKA